METPRHTAALFLKHAYARADAAAGNLVAEGSIAVRERDLATRLQDEITANANAELERANATLQRGAMDAWSTRQAAAQMRAQTLGNSLSTVGSLFSNSLRSGK